MLLRSQLEGRLDECARLIDSGVEIIDPMTTYIEAGIEIGPGYAPLVPRREGWNVVVHVS